MRIGFFAWNPFQVYQIQSIAEQFADSVFILDNKRKTVDFRRLFPQEFLNSLPGEIQYVGRSDLPNLDGKFDAIVCQTAFGHMERFNSTKIVGMQYSMSKERHQYGAWRCLCDLNLVYGRYSEARIAPLSPTAMVGNPRFDRWFSNSLDAAKLESLGSKLDPSKKTLLYLPTWGQLSSLSLYGKAISGLSKTYNVIAKVHHKTDSHEFERRLTLAGEGLKNTFGASDDLLYLLKVSDVVLSDFSGAIFDAINVGKPVILLQHNAESLVGAEKFGLESIEYARRDQIGPVVSEPHLLAGIVEKVVDGYIDFSEANAKLRDECFARQRDCGAAAAEAITSFLRNPTKRAYYQLYVRDALREYREKEENRNKSKGSKEKKLALRKRTKVLPKGANDLTPKRNKFASRSVPFLKKAKLKSAMDRLLGAAHPAIELLWHVSSIKSKSPFIGRWFAKMLPSHRLVALSKSFAAKGDMEMSIWLAQMGYRRSTSTGLAPYINTLIRFDRREELAELVTELLSAPATKRARCLSRTIRACEYLTDRYGDVRAARAEVLEYVVKRLKHSTDKKENSRWIRLLLGNRWYGAAEAFARPSIVSPKGLDAVKSAVERAKSRMKQFYHLTELANHNFDSARNAEDYLCLYNGRTEKVGNLPGVTFAEYFLPSYFYVERFTEEGAHSRICALLTQTAEVLHSSGIALIPLHQFRLDNAVPSGHWPLSFSYHTTGNRRGWWHLKDSPVPGFFTIDRFGYSGWSELGNRSQLPSEARNASMQDVVEQWNFLQRKFINSRTSKYQQEQIPFRRPLRKYIFLPLQLIDDSVAKLAYIPTLDLAAKLVRFIPERGYDLVIKRHPKCTSPDVEKFLEELRGHKNVHLTNSAIHDVISDAEAVFTVNSGVGLEALLRGKRVITTGKSEYALASTVVENESQLIDAIEGIGEAYDLERAQRFAYYYFSHYAFSLDDQEKFREKILGACGYQTTQSGLVQP